MVRSVRERFNPRLQVAGKHVIHLCFRQVSAPPLPDCGRIQRQHSSERNRKHNRVAAAKLAGWTTIPAEVVEADDARAIVIATSTNLIQRQGLSTIERGKAYKALLDAKNRQGYRSEPGGGGRYFLPKYLLVGFIAGRSLVSC